MPVPATPFAKTFLQRRWRRAPLEIFRAVESHGVHLLAASISFYFMLSLVPMLFLLLAVLGHTLRGQAVRPELLDAVREFVPFLSGEIVRNLEPVVQDPKLLGWIGGIALFLSTDLVFVAVQTSLDRIFAPGRRGFLRSKGVSVLLGVGVFCVILLTIAVHAVGESLERLDLQAVPDPIGLHLSTWTIVLLLLVCFTLAIRLLPHVHVPWRYAFFGAALGTGVWATAKAWYVGYLANVSKVGPLFGSLSAVILTLIWVWVSAFAFLLGAELARWLVLSDPERARAGRDDAIGPRETLPEDR